MCIRDSLWPLQSGARPGLEPATCESHVRCPTNIATSPLVFTKCQAVVCELSHTCNIYTLVYLRDQSSTIYNILTSINRGFCIQHNGTPLILINGIDISQPVNQSSASHYGLPFPTALWDNMITIVSSATVHSLYIIN